jgi:hypothetical protein
LPCNMRSSMYNADPNLCTKLSAKRSPKPKVKLRSLKQSIPDNRSSDAYSTTSAKFTTNS